MNRYRLFRLLRHNSSLSYRRSPAFEQSVVAKVLMFIGAGFMAIYFIFIAIAMAVLANEECQPAMLIFVLPLFLLIDFFVRFAVQQTPAMMMKPYLLLPIPRNSVIESFLCSSLLSGYNWIWLFLFVPYAYITFFGEATLLESTAVLFSGMLLVMANSQWYLLVRTLVARSLWWWAVPIVVYAVLLLPLILSDTKVFDTFYDQMLTLGATWWFTLFCAALLAAFFFINRKLQFRYAYEEIAREEKKPESIHSVSKFTFLERFGLMGEYLKLELKSIMRNKAIRSRVLMSLALIVLFSVLIAYTDIYDSPMMLNFWCYYCFAIYGMTALVKIMGPEGNYIDFLMVHRENILALLKAKYYFHVGILIVPFLIMLPAVIEGKFSLLMMLAYTFLTSGLLYATLFQLAVYNKQTLPLEQKITGKGNVENGLQLAIELVAMFIPLVLVGLLLAFLDEDTTYLILCLIGIVMTILHPYWLKNIYRRIMNRRYDNLEGFHASR